MSRVVLTDELRAEYERLFAACEIRPERAAEVDALADGLLADWGRYHAVGGRLKIPWFAVAVLHYAAISRDFDVHPHNGDPLSDRTRHVPDGRPLDGEPPFAWEASAADALRLWHVDRWEDWSIAGTLFALEGRGGWGYRLNHPEVPSPYLWNYSTHYTQGKYVTDDSWSDTAISRRCGVAVLLRRLAERGSVELIPIPGKSNLPMSALHPETAAEMAIKAGAPKRAALRFSRLRRVELNISHPRDSTIS